MIFSYLKTAIEDHFSTFEEWYALSNHLTFIELICLLGVPKFTFFECKLPFSLCFQNMR